MGREGGGGGHFVSLVPSFNSVSDADGQIKVTEVAARPLTQDLLDHNVTNIKRQVLLKLCLWAVD